LPRVAVVAMSVGAVIAVGSLVPRYLVRLETGGHLMVGQTGIVRNEVDTFLRRGAPG
jgi:hypothetical protein